MSRFWSGMILGLALVPVLLAPARAEAVDPGVRDVASLVYFANRHNRLWDWVEDRIEETAKGLEDGRDRDALRRLEYDFYVKWGGTQERIGGTGAVDRAIEKYGSALAVRLPPAKSRQARERYVALRLDEAQAILDSEEDLAPAQAHVTAVLALESLESASRSRAEGLEVRIDSREGLRLLDAGDYTRGYDLLAAVLKKYGDRRLPIMRELRGRLDEVERTTGVLRLQPLDVSAALKGLKAAFVGEILMRPEKAAVHVVRADFTVDEKPLLVIDAPRDAPGRVRLKKAKDETFVLRFDFGGRRPPLQIPFDFRSGDRSMELPDRVPARMAFVPDGPRGPFFIGLYEVSRGEWAAAGRPRVRGDAKLPVENVVQAEIRAFLRDAGVALATPQEWTLAAIGRDGRDLPWTRLPWDVSKIKRDLLAFAKKRAAIDGPVQPVESRPEGMGPYGLHHAFGNVWEIVDGWFAMGGGGVSQEYPLYLHDANTNDPWAVDFMRDPRPLQPAIGGLDRETKRRWRDVVGEDELTRVDQEGIGFRVVRRVKR